MLYYRWSPGKNAINTVHVLDVAGAAWASANWMAREGRKSANQIAGKPLLFHNDKNKVKEVDGMIPSSEKPIAPLFNLVLYVSVYILSVDIAVGGWFPEYYAQHWPDHLRLFWDYSGVLLYGREHDVQGPYLFLCNWITNAQTDSLQIMDDIEDINEHHVSAWTEMLEKSKPPIHNTPLTAYMDKFMLEKKTVSLDNSKIKQILGYKLLKPEFNHETIKEVVDKWKEEGIWPNLDWCLYLIH